MRAVLLTDTKGLPAAAAKPELPAANASLSLEPRPALTSVPRLAAPPVDGMSAAGARRLSLRGRALPLVGRAQCVRMVSSAAGCVAAPSPAAEVCGAAECCPPELLSAGVACRGPRAALEVLIACHGISSSSRESPGSASCNATRARFAIDHDVRPGSELGTMLRSRTLFWFEVTTMVQQGEHQNISGAMHQAFHAL